jgi:hypothetical protein
MSGGNCRGVDARSGFQAFDEHDHPEDRQPGGQKKNVPEMPSEWRSRDGDVYETRHWSPLSFPVTT